MPSTFQSSRPNTQIIGMGSGYKLAARKGYDHIKPAKLYSIGADALSDPRWIIARSKGEAIEVGERLFENYDRFNNCMKAGCPEAQPIELDHGWFAVIYAYRYERSSVGKSQNIHGTYFAHGARTRQEAIDVALKRYRENRGAGRNPVIQTMIVGLVSEIDWNRVSEEFRQIQAKSGNTPMFDMSVINYRTSCDWHPPSGENLNAEITSGDLDKDSACKISYRPDEKLPPPVMTVLK